MRRRVVVTAAAVLLPAVLVLPHEAAAQGRGRPKGPRTNGASTSQTGSAPPAVAFRQFGSWLDDASAPTPGEGRTAIAVGYWRMSGASQMNVPMVDVGYGLGPRLQVSASVPFYRSSYEGTTARGLDDVYLSGKFTLIDPSETESQFGLAVSPVLEVLSAGAQNGRLHYALPVSVELRRQPFRVYGSAGYFSRGALFSAGAIEYGMASGLVLTGALMQSYSTVDDPTLTALGIGRQRVDITAAVGYPLGTAASAYVSVGRTLTSVAEGGTSFGISGGISFRFSSPLASQ